MIAKKSQKLSMQNGLCSSIRYRRQLDIISGQYSRNRAGKCLCHVLSLTFSRLCPNCPNCPAEIDTTSPHGFKWLGPRGESSLVHSYQIPGWLAPASPIWSKGAESKPIKHIFVSISTPIHFPMTSCSNMLNLRGRALRLAIATSSGSAYLLFGYDQVVTGLSSGAQILANRLIGCPRRPCVATKLSLSNWKSHFWLPRNHCCSL